MGVRIRAEQPGDVEAVRRVHEAAFPTNVEAKLVDALRAAGKASVSLVAAATIEPTAAHEELARGAKREPPLPSGERAGVRGAWRGEAIVGHILFSPVALAEGAAGASGLGLAPVAVLPDWQGRGVGALLCQAGLKACQALGAGFVVVLGEPAYYSRFGFAPASRWGLTSEYDAGDAFQALELRPGGILKEGGLVRYSEEFGKPRGD